MGTIDNVRGLTLQLYGGPQQNLTGNVTLWIDNIVFEQAQNQIPGDANGDGKVDTTDTQAVYTALGTTMKDQNYNPDADANRDGLISKPDFTDVVQNQNVATTITVNTSPATNSLLGLRVERRRSDSPPLIIRPIHRTGCGSHVGSPINQSNA